MQRLRLVPREAAAAADVDSVREAALRVLEPSFGGGDDPPGQRDGAEVTPAPPAAPNQDGLAPGELCGRLHVMAQTRLEDRQLCAGGQLLGQGCAAKDTHRL